MRTRTLFLVSLLAVAAGCSKRDRSPTVASGEGFTITAADLKARIEEQPPAIRNRYTTADRREELLESMVRFELLAQEAVKRKLDQDPEVQAAVKKIIVQQLIRQQFDEGANKADDALVKKYYDEHLDEFVKPARVRVQLVWFEAPQGTPERAAKLTEAKKLLTGLKAADPANPQAFASAARESSQDLASKASGGDLGFRTSDELTSQYAKELATAAFALKDVGQLSDVVDTPRGLAVMKLTGKQPAVNLPFDEVKPQLAGRVGREKRSRDFDEYVSRLRTGSKVTINKEEVAKVTFGTGTQAITPAAPMPSRSGSPELPPHGAASPGRP